MTITMEAKVVQFFLVSWVNTYKNRGMVTTQADFHQKWIVALKGRREDKFRMEWEASKTIRELRDLKYLDAACGGEAFLAELFAQVMKYQNWVGWIRESRATFRSAKREIDKAEKKLLMTEAVIKRLPPSEATRRLCQHIREAAASAEGIRGRIQWEQQQFWKEALATNPFEYDPDVDGVYVPANSIVGVIPFSAFAHQEQPEASTPIGYIKLPDDRSRSEAENPFPPLQPINKKQDLDRQFRHRVASILHCVFAKLTRLTIARLIVLTYICAELVEYDAKGKLRIIADKRTFTVDAVYQQIKTMEFADCKKGH